MRISNDRFKNLRGPLMVGGAACFFLGVAGYWFTGGFNFPSDPAPLPSSRKAMPHPVSPAVPRPETPVSPPVTTPPVEADVGNLLTFAEKQAQLEVVKLDVAIAEQNAKLKELREGKPLAQPVRQVVPQPVAVLPAELPPLPPLATASLGELPSLPSSIQSPRRRSGLIAVQGVDGNLSAVFATGSGKKTVRVGESVMGSKVRSITLDGVTLASGKTISLED